MRRRQLAKLPTATAALICHTLATSLHVAAASGAPDLSDGQIAGVVIGSVGGALLLSLLIFLVCCLRGSRRRQTGDLTWAKAGDLEAVAMAQTPHHPLSGPCPADLAEAARDSGTTTDAAGGDGGSGCAPVADTDASYAGNARTDISTVTGEGQSQSAAGGIDLAAFPSFPPSPRSPAQPQPGRKMGFFRGRSSASHVGRNAEGGGTMAQFFVVPKGNSNVKDKNLQVSRSARVETSAEVELAEPFQPAATNMGPPLSKSSMLLRWLNGADEGMPETAAAAQMAAAAAAAKEGSGGRHVDRNGAGVRGAGRGAGGRGGALGMSLDRLPLLSLAAQQKGIVWSKMPPSVASSPAVSQAEGSSVHMLRGTWKRSDAPEDTATAISGHTPPHGAAAALAAWHGGDDRYPSSLGQASLESFSPPSGGGAQRSATSTSSALGSRLHRPGIVFDYVMRSSRSPASSRANTGGGAASSRAPTIGGGAVLPVSSSGGVVDRVASSGGGAAAAAAGFGGDDAFTMGALPDEHMLAQVLQRVSPSPEQDAAAARPASGRPWLHQTPPMKLTSLQEADGEEAEGEELVPSPLPRPSLLALSSSKHLFSAAAMSPPPSPGTGLSPPLTPSGGQSPLPPPGQCIYPSPATPAGMVLSPGQHSPPMPAEASLARVSEQIVARPCWTHFGDGDEHHHLTGTPSGGFVHGAVGSDPATAAGSRLIPEPPLPNVSLGPLGPAVAAAVANKGEGVRTVSPFLKESGGGGGGADHGRVSESELAAGYAGQDPPYYADAADDASARGTGWASATTVPIGLDRSASAGAGSVAAAAGADIGGRHSVFMLPGRRPTDIAMAAAPPGGAPPASPRGSTTPSQRRSVFPPMLHVSQSGRSLRSQTSLISPSLSMHYPDLPDAPGVAVAALYRQDGSAAGSVGTSTAPTPRGDAGTAAS